jgi:hypothetical protein
MSLERTAEFHLDPIQAHTPIHIVTCFDYKLSLVFNLTHPLKYQIATLLSQDNHALLIRAVQYQNIIGWDLFQRGFTSSLWTQLFNVVTAVNDNHKQ